MKLLEFTSNSPAENLAIDEALLETAESAIDYPEVLRIWEPNAPMVVLGRSSPRSREVNIDYCRAREIPVFRRCSGGQTIVTGPGCLMYAVLLNYQKRPELRMLENAHRFVMEQMRSSLHSIGIGTEMRGTSDLTIDDRKFSGNSLRCKRNWMIYHGTMICQFDLTLIGRCLNRPIREPEYRNGRSHIEFLTQLDVSSHELGQAMIGTWNANSEFKNWPAEQARVLATEKYKSDAWNHKVP